MRIRNSYSSFGWIDVDVFVFNQAEVAPTVVTFSALLMWDRRSDLLGLAAI